MDRLLFTSFIPPFFVTFMIAVFVLVMQTLWLYIDDIAGKGLGLFLIMELLTYKSVALFPLALPLGILISSVMVMGNMAERYELSSFKSAGVSLSRMMRSLVYYAIFCGLFSYYCSNTLMPVANLKFGSRMYDIQQQKPAMQLEAGVFNDDFRNFSIRIGRRGADGRSIYDVLMYDHSNMNRGQFTQVVAKTGEMYSSPDGKYFIMHLKDGHQYVETRANNFSNTDGSYPFIRTHFKEWYKVFDLSEFELNRTNEELFKSNRSMMSIKELRTAIDSMALKILKRQVTYSNTIARYYLLQLTDSTIIRMEANNKSEEELLREKYENELEEEETADADSAQISQDSAAMKLEKLSFLRDSVKESMENLKFSMDSARDANIKKILEGEKGSTTLDKDGSSLKTKKMPTTPEGVPGPKPLPPELKEELKNYDRFIDLLPEQGQMRAYSRAKNAARSIRSQAESANYSLERDRENRVKYVYEMHTKYSLAVVCVIFLFIGAPMGAIVRKGGFGYPILVSIIFFMLFIVLTIFCRKIAESFVTPAWLAAWLPCLVLFPIGALLTTKAMNDSKVIDWDVFFQRIRKLFPKSTDDSKILDASE